MKKAVVAIASIVVAIALGLGGVRAFAKTDVSFALRMESGVCRPTDPEKITAAWPQKVTWTVTNVDCPPQYVSIRTFRHPIGGGQYDPPEEILDQRQVDGGPVTTAVPVPLEGKIRFKIRLWSTLYKYQIWLGENQGSLDMRRDPDIEVWP